MKDESQNTTQGLKSIRISDKYCGFCKLFLVRKQQCCSTTGESLVELMCGFGVGDPLDDMRALRSEIDIERKQHRHQRPDVRRRRLSHATATVFGNDLRDSSTSISPMQHKVVGRLTMP